MVGTDGSEIVRLPDTVAQPVAFSRGEPPLIVVEFRTNPVIFSTPWMITVPPPTESGDVPFSSAPLTNLSR